MFLLALIVWFDVLLVISFLCVVLILVIYMRAKKNFLLICCSIQLIVKYVLIVAGQAVYKYTLGPTCQFCIPQAIILNFCNVSMHALVSCMMFDAWLHVSSWSQERHFGNSEAMNKQRMVYYCVIAFIFPLMPTIVIVTLLVAYPTEPIVQPLAFFCYITGNIFIKLLTFAGWFILFSVPGMFFSIYLLFKTIWMREKSVRKGRTTHLTWYSIARVAIATIIYSIISFSSYLPTIIFYPSDDTFPYDYRGPELNMGVASPYFNSLLCDCKYYDPRIAYYAATSCPSMSTFLPCTSGIAFFIMYGFGKHARKTYALMYDGARHFFSRDEKKKERKHPSPNIRQGTIFV